MRTLLIIIAASWSFTACKSTADRTGSALLDGEGTEVQKLFTINRTFKHGDEHEIAIDPTRAIEQITCKYHGDYRVQEIGPDGQPTRNDEGQPRFKDGMYAFGYVVSPTGQEQEVATKKFIDAFETDNWHDLTAAKGPKFVIKFRHSDRYANDPDVVAANTTIRLESILVRYATDPNARFQEFMYNRDYDYGLSPDAVAVTNGGSHKVKIPKSKRITRIDVRWGDEKPRQNGVYVPGTANGRLLVNGQAQGTWRNVAAIETQVWAPVQAPAPAGDDHEIAISFSGDDARVHWIKVFYEE